MDQNEPIQILKPLYGLCKSEDYRCETNSKFRLHELLMQQSTGDFALFFKTVMYILICISGSYVDGILQVGAEEQKYEMQQKFKEKCDATFSNRKMFTYNGMKIDTPNSQLRTLSQPEYIERPKMLDKTAKCTIYRSINARLIWLVTKRPDISASIESNVTEKKHTSKEISFVNSIVKHLQSTEY